MTTAILPGTFDPVTVGHIDLIRRAVTCCDELVVAVGNNIRKAPLFAASERAQMLQQSLPPGNIRVIVFEGLLVDAAQEVGATLVIKGVRNGADLGAESTQAAFNRDLAGIETVLLPTSSEYSHISSTMIRELAAWGVPPTDYVPPAVWEHWPKPEMPARRSQVTPLNATPKQEG